MINNRDNFICPVCHTGLVWPEVYCSQCRQRYLLTSIESSVSNDEPVAICDFRDSSGYVERDRRDLHAHLKILEGLYHSVDDNKQMRYRWSQLITVTISARILSKLMKFLRK